MKNKESKLTKVEIIALFESSGYKYNSEIHHQLLEFLNPISNSSICFKYNSKTTLRSVQTFILSHEFTRGYKLGKSNTQDTIKEALGIS